MHPTLGVSISIVVMFILGQVLHAWLRAANTVQSKLNGITTYDQYLKLNAARVATRFFLAYCIFAAWQEGWLLVAVGAIIPSATWVKNALPTNVATAGVFGYIIDSVIDQAAGIAAKKWPWIQREIPPEESVTKPDPESKVA